MNALLNVQDLQVSFQSYAGEVQAVRGVSFAVQEGETVALVGESGCGKSVTAKTLMGLINCPPGRIQDGSHILYQGRDILQFRQEDWAAYRGGECAMIFQDALTSLNPTMKVGIQIAETLMLHKGLNKKTALEEAVELLRLVGIPQPGQRVKQYPHEFSGGMRQRVMIAIALSCGPRLLLADEPTTALDVTIQAQIIELIKSLQQKLNTAVILITHNLGIVADIADRILVMYAGKIVESGTLRQIFYRPRHPYTWSLLRAIPRLDLVGKQALVSIEGVPPNLITPPEGCAFCGRCPFAMEVCQAEEPPAFFFEEDHRALCWLHHTHAADSVADVPFETGGILL